jgi:hypothetical protein
MRESPARDRLYEPTKDMSGVRIGSDFWPEIRWGAHEAQVKHARVIPWGQSRDTYHKQRGWK